MKNLLLIAFSLFLLSCQSNDQTENSKTIFSGKFINSESDKIYLNKRPFKKEIALDEAGNFKVELDSIEEGEYLFHNMREGGTLYFIPGQDLHLTVDAAEFDETLSFSGSGANPSKFLAAYFLREEKIVDQRKEMYNQDEATFSAFNEKNKAENLALLAKFANLPKNFIQEKSEEIEMQSLVNMQRFVNVQRKESPSYQPSGEFSKMLAAIDLDQSEDFENLPVYNQFVQIRLKSGSMEEVLTRLKNIKSENIKSSIISGLKNRLRSDSETLHEDYELLVAACTDEKMKQVIIEKYNKVKLLATGSPSPSFNFEDQFGKMVKLEELQGKNIYIDIWATWCGPCIAEVPALKKLEAAYKNKNLEFVSISIDKLQDKNKWLAMIEEKDLGGIQLLADKDYETQFIKAYAINSIPRFILLDKKGNIVNTDAPRPSSEKEIQALFNQLEM